MVLRSGDLLKISFMGPLGLKEMNFCRWDLGMSTFFKNLPHESNVQPQLEALEDEFG